MLPSLLGCIDLELPLSYTSVVAVAYIYRIYEAEFDLLRLTSHAAQSAERPPSGSAVTQTEWLTDRVTEWAGQISARAGRHSETSGTFIHSSGLFSFATWFKGRPWNCFVLYYSLFVYLSTYFRSLFYVRICGLFCSDSFDSNYKWFMKSANLGLVQHSLCRCAGVATLTSEEVIFAAWHVLWLSAPRVAGGRVVSVSMA